MKKCTLLMCVILLLCACSNTVEKPNVVKYVDGLIGMYPNYRSNDIAESALLDSIAKHNRPIGQIASDLKGVDFRYVRLIENQNNGSKSALFVSDGCASDIENPNGNPKYLITDIHIRVLGGVDAETAAILDENSKYQISGVLHAWDSEDVFFATHKVGSCVDFGTYILDDMVVTAVKQ